MTELQLEQAKHNLEEAQVYINKMRNNLELLEVDKFKDLKKAYSEGAVIEVYKWVTEDKWEWDTITRPYFDVKRDSYRIKDNISISSWQVHKDIIKQYWNGAIIEGKQSYNEWHEEHNPKWYFDAEYRVKPNTWKLPEYEDGSEWVAGFDGMVTTDIYESYTKVGRRRATRALAEHCAKESKTRDLLEAWRDYLEPDWVDNMDAFAYHLYVDSYEKYTVSLDTNIRVLGTVYGSKETMQKICDALNNKEIRL